MFERINIDTILDNVGEFFNIELIVIHVNKLRVISNKLSPYVFGFQSYGYYKKRRASTLMLYK